MEYGKASSIRLHLRSESSFARSSEIADPVRLKTRIFSFQTCSGVLVVLAIFRRGFSPDVCIQFGPLETVKPSLEWEGYPHVRNVAQLVTLMYLRIVRVFAQDGVLAGQTLPPIRSRASIIVTEMPFCNRRSAHRSPETPAPIMQTRTLREPGSSTVTMLTSCRSLGRKERRSTAIARKCGAVLSQCRLWLMLCTIAQRRASRGGGISGSQRGAAEACCAPLMVGDKALTKISSRYTSVVIAGSGGAETDAVGDLLGSIAWERYALTRFQHTIRCLQIQTPGEKSDEQ
jgi:hypothetical protein